MKIYAPVKDANGVWCTVRFINGVGETNDPKLIKWFEKHGYRLEDPTPEVTPVNTEEVLTAVLEEVGEPGEPSFEEMTPLELREWAKANGLGGQIKNIRNKEKLLEIIRG